MMQARDEVDLATLDAQWDYLLTLLPPEPELERLAKETGALLRRREFGSATALLRLLLSYGICDLSLVGTAAWARANGSAVVSDVAVLKRLRKAGPWLERLIAYVLSKRLQVEAPVKGLQLRMIDGSSLSLPGSVGGDWRLHASYDPWTARLQGVELTDWSVGEHLRRHKLAPDEIAVADRGYSNRDGMASIVEQGAQFIVRLNWHAVPLETPEGEPFDLFAALRTLPKTGAREFAVRTAPHAERQIPGIPCRLVAVRKSLAAADRAKKAAIREARRKNRAVDPRVLEACEYIFVLTNVPSERLATSEILAVYRLRWQIELEFKRLKSLLKFDTIRAKEPAVVRAYVLAKLLGALLVEELASFSPWGFHLVDSSSGLNPNQEASLLLEGYAGSL